MICANKVRLNAEKAFALASALFPQEEWVPHGTGIFVAKNRLLGGYKEQAKLYREISDIRILIEHGNIVYFLPEQSNGEEIGKKHIDTVINGAIVELKTVSGNRTTLGKSFKKGYKQGLSILKNNPQIKADHNVFLRIFTPFAVESVRAKLAGELKNTTDSGCCICYFESTDKLYFWTYDELRSMLK